MSVTDAHPTAVVAEDTVAYGDLTVGKFVFVGISGSGGPVDLGPGAVLRSHTALYQGIRACSRFTTGDGVLVREGTVLGDDVCVESHTVLEHHVTVGDRVRIHSSCFIAEWTVLEDDARIGPGVRITSVRYPNRPDTKANLEKVTVAQRAIVGTGAVVVRDVPDGGVVVGNPAGPAGGRSNDR